jgi:hypothetical protein
MAAGGLEFLIYEKRGEVEEKGGQNRRKGPSSTPPRTDTPGSREV